MLYYGHMKTGFSGYRRVYGLLLNTYGKSWHVRVSFLLALISRTSKFVALPVAASQVIGSIAVKDYSQARDMVLIFSAFSALVGILSPLTRYIALLGENKIYASNMNRYFNALLAMDVKHFNESMTGYLTTATRQYSDSALQLVRKLRDSYFGTVFSIIVPVGVIFFVDRQLGLLVFALSSVQAVYLLWASQKVAPYRTRSREMYKYISGLISDAITNITAIKSTAQETVIAKNVGLNMKKETALFVARYKAQVFLIAGREFITVSFFLSLFWVTVGRISTGNIDIAGAALIISYAFLILTAIYDLSDAVDEHDDFVDKLLPAFEMLDRKNRIVDPEHPLSLGKVRGNIDCNNVDFAYSEQDTPVPVLVSFSLHIPAGQKLGIVGLSGAGKSTFTKLLLRFEDVTGGSICLDGTNIRDVTQSELRRNIAYVPQEPLLFHSTVAENIKLSKPNASETEIRQAASSAHALNFITSLPNGFDSVVGERGVKLSGGQKQRIAIARAVLQDAPIIVLDEATSALDSESEQIIKESFNEILKGKTAIVVAHRLSTLSEMDRIVLFEDGAIVEDGSHEKLLKSNGLYSKLWKRQQSHPETLETIDVQLKNL